MFHLFAASYISWHKWRILVQSSGCWFWHAAHSHTHIYTLHECSKSCGNNIPDGKVHGAPCGPHELCCMGCFISEIIFIFSPSGLECDRSNKSLVECGRQLIFPANLRSLSLLCLTFTTCVVLRCHPGNSSRCAMELDNMGLFEAGENWVLISQMNRYNSYECRHTPCRHGLGFKAAYLAKFVADVFVPETSSTDWKQRQEIKVVGRYFAE